MRRTVLSLIFYAIALIPFVSCSGSSETGYLDVSKEIKADDPIVIRAADGVVFDINMDSGTVAKALSISPQVEFETGFTDERTLCIYPKEKLAYNTSYKVSANKSKLFGVKGGSETFSVRTLAPVVEVKCGHLDVASDNTFSLTVTFISSDELDSQYLESGMKVKGSGKPVWNHSEDGLTHSFTAGGITAQAKPSAFEMSYSYPKYALADSRSWPVPAAGEFVVMDSSFEGDPFRFEVAFSAPLSKDQDFASLVSLPSAGKPRFSVENNVLKIYPSVEATEKQFVSISKGIKSQKGSKLSEDFERYFVIPGTGPSVRFTSSGVILPSSNGKNIFFESINYAKVEVRVHRIYENNILQHMQSNKLSDADSYVRNVARCVADTTFALADPSSAKLRSRNMYGLDLSGLVAVQKGAIYKIEIRGREPLAALPDDYYDSDYWFGSYQDYSARVRNILVSDLSVIAKGSDRGLYSFFVTDIVAATPVRGASVKVYDSVNQEIASGTTDARGCFECNLGEEKPKTAIVSSGSDKSYISLDNGAAISMSNFDVDGTAVRGGQKGFIFGERGVWRPGDDIHLTFISMLDEGVLPDNHPVSAVLRNPQGQAVQSLVNSHGSNGIYTFDFKTGASAPTGNYEVEISAGGSKFTKQLKIETVKPNNILIDMALNDKPVLPARSVKGTVSGKWLVGLPAAGLETRIESTLSKTSTKFAKYPKYKFEDASRVFEVQTKEIFKGVTNQNGEVSFSTSVAGNMRYPGFLNAVLTTRIFEKSGDFSIDRYSATVSPYNTYIGVQIPEKENRWGEMYLDKDRMQTFPLLALTPQGEKVAGLVSAEVEVYKMGWSWWWSSSETLAYYSKDSYNQPFKIFNASIKDGEGSFRLDFSGEESGFYFVRITDTKGGHAASAVFMVCQENENSRNGASESAVKLPMSLDKERYSVGETARITVPSAAESKILVSIEKSDRVLNSYWVDGQEGNTVIPVKVEAGMAPDVYAVLTLIQPHSTTKNDAPIRMFGVQRIPVDDNSTHITPVIDVPAKIKPESSTTVTVKEKDGRPMSYVLAVVDEGLLSLTRFKTPDPWKSFYATEALGVHTWDLYDLVIGAYGARMEQMFAIGGDGSEEALAPNNQAERFKPVALFYGPFTVKAGGSQKHTVEMPQYIGNVRVMVVASDGRAVGSAEKSVTVSKPLMVQSTLPRVFGTEDEAEIPVTIFATEDNIGKVNVSFSAEGALRTEGATSASVNVTKAGEQTVNFKVKASAAEGVGKITATAEGGNDTSRQTLEVNVREPNVPVTTSQVSLIKAGGETSFDFAVLGEEGARFLSVEASSLPPIDLGNRLSYLTTYPHGCLEQTVSAAFPQLYLTSLAKEGVLQPADCQKNIEAAIAALPTFAISGGGMTYWPGTSSYSGANVWGTIYATHFMVEAQKKGYAVPVSLKKANISFLRGVASGKTFDAVSRAYACYVLTLSGTSARSEMNRLREDAASLPADAVWYLAASYALDGKKDVARDLVSGGLRNETVERFSPIFASEERSVAVAAMTYGLINERVQAFKCVESLSKWLSDRNHYMSTQSAAWALNAVAAYVETYGSDKLDVNVKAAGKEFILKSDGGAVSQTVAAGSESVPVSVKNNSKSDAYLVVSSRGIPQKGQESTFANGLNLFVRYTLADGSQVDPASLPQGTDFTVNAYIVNTSAVQDYTNLALSQIFPAGWEIRGERNGELYQDIRDDRVCTYFDLPRSASITIKTRVTATYAGRFYLPATVCEAMYDDSASASVAGCWCEVKNF